MFDSVDIFGDRPLVVSFEGWNDAGEAASGAVRVVKDALGLSPVFEVDAEMYFDFQFNRPVASLGADGSRSLVWPGVSLFAPAGGLGAHVLLGSEPSRNWRSFVAEISELIEDREISGVIFVGAMLADVPHSRPISVSVTSESAVVREVAGVERSHYEGPVGILSVLAAAVTEAGVPSAAVWASVPHYVHSVPSPKATLALVEKVSEVVGFSVPVGELVAEASAWESGVDALARDDEDMSAYIGRLERARDTVDSPEASGDAIAEEFENFLRGQDEGGRGV